MYTKRYFKLMRTSLTNAGIQVDLENDEAVITAFRELCSRRTKSVYGKWLATHQERGISFSERGRRGVVNRGRRLSGDHLSEDEAYAAGCSALGGPEQSRAIREGLLKIYGSEENVSEVFRQRRDTLVAKSLNKPIADLTRVDRRAFNRKIGFYNQNPREWKRKQAEAYVGHPVEDSDIDRVFSSYMSFRFSRSRLENAHNGYLRTKKGWFEFASHPNRIFFRSSWEEHLLSVLDSLYARGLIVFVTVPDRIDYTVGGVEHRYYPDLEWVTAAGLRRVCEVKPERMLAQGMNPCKLAAARASIGADFVVFTERELFATGGETLEQTCLK